MITKENPVSKETLAQIISHFMLRLGIPAHLNGYHYLRTSLEMVVQDMSLVGSPTKLLYPDVAKIHGTTDVKVERAIRNAIEVSWDRGDTDVFDELFGYSRIGNHPRPTNSVYIAMVADYIRLHYWKTTKEV